MTRVKEIEKEVNGLSNRELSDFRQWFAEYDAKVWNEEMEEDIENGLLDDLANDALNAHKNGDSQEL